MFKILNHSASYQLSYSKWSQKLKTITKLEGIANERLRILIEPLLLLLQEAMGSTTVTTVVSYLWLRDLKYLLSIMSPQYDILISSIASIDYETSKLSTSIKKTLKIFQAPLFFLFVANGHPFCLFKRVVRLVRGRWWWRMLVIMIVLVMRVMQACGWWASWWSDPLFLSFLDPRRSLEGLPVWCGGPSSILPAWNGIYWEARKQINMQTIDVRQSFRSNLCNLKSTKSSRPKRNQVEYMGRSLVRLLASVFILGYIGDRTIQKTWKREVKGFEQQTITNNNWEKRSSSLPFHFLFLFPFAFPTIFLIKNNNVTFFAAKS